MKIFSMKCAGCAAPIQIKQQTTEFVCAYCGASQFVDRSGGIITLNLVAESLAKVQKGTDKTASELALVRLGKKRREIIYPSIQYKPDPPQEPTVKRFIKRSLWEKFWTLLWHGGGLAGENHMRGIERSEYFSREFWKEYDIKLADYNRSMLDFPSIEKSNEILLEDYRKRIEAIDAEIDFHQGIVDKR